jgi:Ca2+:H+ antiporter
LASVTTGALFVAFGGGWLADLSNPLWYAFIMAWLFGVILAAAFSVVHHAEALAERLGEPLGTLILTLAVTGIEVMMISAVMYAGPGNAAMARDAMFAVIMIVMNGMVGLALLLGGLRFREQTYNLAGANAFLAVIVPLGVLGLVIPNFTHSSPGPTLSSLHSIFLIVMALSLYAVFLAIQNVVHRDYFLDPAEGAARTPATAGHAGEAAHPAPSLVYHGLLLVVNILPLVLLSKKLAIPIEHGIDTLHAPAAMGGFLVAILILSPESLGAIRAALRNQLQRAVNILLGSVLATISLTIPSVLVIGFLTNREIVLGLDEVGMILLVLTLAVSAITFNSQKTNVLLGAVHLILFVAYLMLMFDR